jgi:hypothetical protein
MTRSTSALLVVAAVGVAGLAAACSKSSTEACAGTPANLVGTYDLVSYTTGSTTIPAPPAAGVLRFHTTTYGAAITLPGPVAIVDSGTYSVCGATGISQSSVLGNPQFRGTYTFVNDTLSVTGTAAGIAAANVWVKEP